MSPFAAFLGDESGNAAIEYALMVALVAMAIIVIANTTGSNLNARLDQTSQKLK